MCSISVTGLQSSQMLEEYNTYLKIHEQIHSNKNYDEINFISDKVGLNKLVSKCVIQSSDIVTTGTIFKINVSVQDESCNLISVVPNNLKQLLEIAEKSLFGRGSETVFDESVRKAKEIKKDKLVVHDNNFLSHIAFQIRRDFKIANNLRFELHKLNFYETGSFFNQHMDTMYGKDHIATLLIVLPFSFKGGNLKLQFEDCACDNLKLKGNSWCCFFTDCLHQVETITDGTRVTLQYNVYVDQSIGESICDNSFEYDVIQTLIEQNDHYVINPNVFPKITSYLTNKLKEKTIGIVLKHKYHMLTSFDNLKGFDRKFYEYLKSTQLFDMKIDVVSIISSLEDGKNVSVISGRLISPNDNVTDIYITNSSNYFEIENNQHTGNESQAGDNIYTNLVLLISLTTK